MEDKERLQMQFIDWNSYASRQWNLCERERERESSQDGYQGRLAPRWEQIGYKLENEEQVCERGNTLPYTSISSAHNFCDHRNSASGKTEEFNNAFYKCSQ